MGGPGLGAVFVHMDEIGLVIDAEDAVAVHMDEIGLVTAGEDAVSVHMDEITARARQVA